MSRYSRHILLSEVGQNGQDKLSQAKVLVIGAGGLGCPVLQYLVAAGIGAIGIVDFDTVETSNLQRQILFGTASLGKNKALAAKNRLEDLNPTITITAYPEKLTSKNALKLFKGYDIIVDGTDNFATRYLINDASILINKPVVYGAIYKFEGQVSVFNYKNGPSYRCLFPNPPKEGAVANCSEVGVFGVLPGIIGTMQANEVLKIILGFENVISGKLLCYNSRTAQVSTLKIAKSETEFIKVHAMKDCFQDHDQEFSCEIGVQEILLAEALQKKNVCFIDVRELHESPQFDVPNCIRIPISTLEEHINQISPNATNIVFCQSGVRSITAIAILQKHNIKNCFSLKGGILENAEHLKIKIQ
jgi:molybdopterin/thiamine biosynthesis adenylyltransferase/rhodanese-related sulfurtransferase